MADLTPTQLTSATFRTVRKGYDPDEVAAFLARAAGSLEAAQQQATAMEARARAAVARLQELTASQQASPTPVEERPTVAPDEAETISRTLLLAQRTADTAIAEARAEAERIAQEARAEAESTLDSTREMSARLLAEAKDEARRLSEDERDEAQNEVEALRARRDFLLGDVDQLEQFLVDQRERLRSAARQIEAMCERVPAGLGSVRPPAVSPDGATDDTDDADDVDDTDPAGSPLPEPLDDTVELIVPPEATGPFAGIDELVDAIDGAGDDSPLRAGEWADHSDPGPNVDPSEAPGLPTRRPSD